MLTSWHCCIAACAIIALLSCFTAGAETIQPITQVRKLYLDTELELGGEVRAVIYRPASSDYEGAAQELARMVEAKCGIRLPIQCDDPQQAWRKEKRNIIALGNMGNSLLIRWLHYRGYFDPDSGQKRRLQTVHDPWGEGINVVILGGVDLEDVKANLPRLMELLKVPRPGTAVLPPTLDPCPPLSKGTKAKVEEFTRDLAKMHIRYAAYHAGWVCDNYPRLGGEEMVRLYRDCIRRLADAKYYVHLYLFRECQAWEVIEYSPALTDADRLMITNFFRNSVADEKEGIGYVRSSLRGKKLIQGNHPTQAACGVMVVADYLRRFYPSEIHEKWYREALSFFEPYRTKGSYTGDDEGMQAASVENIMNAVWKTEDDPAAHPYLRRALDKFMPTYSNFGTWPAFGDQGRPYRFAANWFLTGAQLYERPDYLWMYHFIRTASPATLAKIPAKGDAAGWWPLPFVPKRPDSFVGLQWAEPDETLFSLASAPWAKENNVGMADCFGKVAFRAGTDPQDDYALLDGVHLGHAYDDQNGILEYSALGRTFLVSLDCDYGTKLSAHNVVSVSVDGLADVNPSRLAARRLWTDLPSFAGTRTVLYTDGRDDRQKYSCPSADWERNVLWLKNRFFVVFDRVIARREGFHSAAAFWRMVGERHDLPDGIEMRQRAGDDEVWFRLTVQGADDFALGQEEDPQAAYCFSRYGKMPPPLDNVPPIVHMLKAHKAAVLKAGESFTMSTCFHAASPRRPDEVDCKQVTPDAVRVVLNREPMLAARGPVSLSGLDVKAELSLVGTHRLCMVSARGLTVSSRRVFEAREPISLEWDLSSGKCEMLAERATQATLGGKAVALPADRSTHQVGGEGVSAALAAALAALAPPAQQRTRHLSQPPERLEVVKQRKLESAVECMWVGAIRPLGNVVIVGQRNGLVQSLSGDALAPAWTYRCGSIVNSVDVGDLNGDGKDEIMVGSDDHHVHALASDGALLWKWKPPFNELKARSAYMQWLWPEPFVKKVAVRDLNKDGKAEVVVGGGMNTFAVDGQGKPLWTYHDSANKDHQPTMMAIVFADVNNDGVEEPIGGASDMWYLGSMCAIGPKGEKVKEFLGDGWCSGVRVALAEDVLGQGKKSLAYGTRRGGVWFYPDPSDLSKWWYRMLGDQVDALASVRSKDGRKVIAAAGGDTQWVTAFDPSGERAWSVYFDAAVTVMTSNASQDKLYVGCEDGTVYELDPNGRVNRLVTVAGQPKVALAYPTGGVAVGTRDGSLYLVR